MLNTEMGKQNTRNAQTSAHMTPHGLGLRMLLYKRFTELLVSYPMARQF